MRVSLTGKEGNEEALTIAATAAVVAANQTAVVNTDGSIMLSWEASR